MKKLAIIGAALFQEPLIIKAREMGLESHVFAWASGVRGETLCDYFYPISIRDRDEILEECERIGIDGIVSIASDLAMETVNYIAEKMGLPGNSIRATDISTNKYLMRKAFEANGDPCPGSVLIDAKVDPGKCGLEYPLIVKPTDRSGSRGVQKVTNLTQLHYAVHRARELSFEDRAIVEEFVEGDEYSVEYISYGGRHYFLTVTQKITSGAPYFIETGHRQPAPLDDETVRRIREVSEHALDTLGLENGAAHIELKIKDGDITLIEIGGRMGGDFIGSDLVELSTGYDFVKAVIDVALGNEPEIPDIKERRKVGVNFIIDADDVVEYEKFKREFTGTILRDHIDSDFSNVVTDSSNRHGYYIFIE